MKVTYTGKEAVRIYNLDWIANETKVVADDLDFTNFKEFKVDKVKKSK